MKLSGKSIRFESMHYLNILILLLIGFLMLYPFWYVLMYSLSTYNEVLGRGLLLRPYGFTLDGIRTVIMDRYIYTAYGNTLFIVIVGTILSTTSTLMFSYSLSRNILGSRVISFLVYFTMLFSGGMIPIFYIVRMTGLFDSLWALILPSLINPFYVFLVRNFFRDVPDSLRESAYIDGAGEIKIFLRIILPLSLPVFSTIVLFYAVGFWNSFFDALIYIRTEKNFPLQLILRRMITSSSSETLGEMLSSADTSRSTVTLATLRMAAVVVTIAPILCVYPFIQKYFVKGVMVGAIKS